MTWKRSIAFGTLSLLWGSAWIATGALADGVPPFAAAAARFTLASAFLFPIILLNSWKLPRGRALIAAFLLSLTLMVAPLVLQLWAAPRVSPATVTVLWACMPVVVALLMMAGRNADKDIRQVPRSAFYTSIIGLGGIAFVVGTGTPLRHFPGTLAVFFAVVAVSSIYVKRELSAVNPVVSAALQMGCAAAVLALISLVTEHGQPRYWNTSTIESLIYLAVLQGAVSFPIYFWMLKELEPYQVAAIEWTIPLAALIESAIVWRQTLSGSMIVGLIVVLITLVILLPSRPESDAVLMLHITE